MKITKRQLRILIREAIDIVNAETGEVIDFGDDSMSGMPDEAMPDLVKRLGLNLSPNDTLSGEDWAKLEDETIGKQDTRRRKKMEHGYKKERERLNIDNLKDRLSQWGQDAGDDWKSDHESGNLPGYPDLEGAAYDLARNAKYEFAEDEWDELVWEFEDEDGVYEFAMGSMG
jgi:hypothetical protein